MTFQSGQSGNPAGRPRGSRNRRTVAEELLGDNAERIMQRAIGMAADDGDKTMLRFCVDRLVPRARHSPVAFALPPVATPADALKAMNALNQGIYDGELTSKEALELSMMVRLASHVAYETDIQRRLEKHAAEKARKEMTWRGFRRRIASLESRPTSPCKARKVRVRAWRPGAEDPR